MASSTRKVTRRSVRRASQHPRGSSLPMRPRARTRRRSLESSGVTPFLLELGTEELPASFIQPALSHLHSLIERMLNEQRLTYQSIRTMGTPRRLTVIVDGLVTKQTSLKQEVLGPPQSVAFSADGVPTKAAQGFARTQGVAVENLEVRETAKGQYVCAVKQEFGRSTSEVLKEHLPKLIQQLTFKKSMKWNDSKLRFARPLRWIVALYGKRTIRFEIGEVSSGSQTFGHRFLSGSRSKSGKPIPIEHPSVYEKTMKRNGVIVDQHERQAMIQSQVNALAKSAKGTVYADNQEDLLREAVYTVECPQAILGSFKQEFLTLPQQVLITAMHEHQGYFSLIGRKGTLLPKFITVTNMKLPNMDLIRLGHERVLSARLNDAQYFFREDRKVTLADRVQQLERITFHQKLGSLSQKISRLQELVPRIAEAVGQTDMKPVCERAAFLAKSDLTTGLVGEFPSLQGVMGREYAQHDGELTEVSEALRELYLPSTPEGVLPQTPVGLYLSLGDRIDTLAAFFLVGMVPSGSEDPFALRRLGYGLVRIIVERGLRVNVVQLILNAEQIIKSQNVAHQSQKEATYGLLDFLLERFMFFSKTVRHVSDDVVEAILAARPSETCDFSDLLSRMEALQRIKSQPEFGTLLVGCKRVHRIIEKECWQQHQVSPELFEHDVEKGLYQAIERAQPLLNTYIHEQNYEAALTILLQLKTPIDEFFDGVMVNASNQNIRANRLSLLCRVNLFFLQLAEFSQIQSP